jgi:hypothetical protein
MGMDAEKHGNPRGKYPVDPKTFKVKEGKLYLFYNMEGFNALEHWNQDQAKLEEEADQFWKSLQGGN